MEIQYQPSQLDRIHLSTHQEKLRKSGTAARKRSEERKEGRRLDRVGLGAEKLLNPKADEELSPDPEGIPQEVRGTRGAGRGSTIDQMPYDDRATGRRIIRNRKIPYLGNRSSSSVSVSSLRSRSSLLQSNENPNLWAIHPIGRAAIGIDFLAAESVPPSVAPSIFDTPLGGLLSKAPPHCLWSERHFIESETSISTRPGWTRDSRKKSRLTPIYLDREKVVQEAQLIWIWVFPLLRIQQLQSISSPTSVSSASISEASL
ncbi:DNA-directed RNA polymerase subunit gamma [Striga asiatica]|uniref:DNA-directed RNA polymerase subunit gamma n=1 Tax=Striga asiatica TaxID=4170 RepID=A0A5A7PZH6_STRAF|nr:DNA-directed RNA polymerase subunit gamma [Striga asiatica]